jgi:hypothetical protein
MTKQLAQSPRPVRMSQKLRAAIEARETEGLTVAAACEKAGLSQAGYFAAMKRPAVQAYRQKVQTQLVTELASLRALAVALALKTGMDLMLNAKSEAIRARMIELFAGDAKGAPVVLQVDARQQSAGYTYPDPDERGKPPQKH